MPKHINSTTIYGEMGQLRLPISSIVEEYKARKNHTVMKLRFSNDIEIQDNSPEIQTFRKLKALM